MKTVTNKNKFKYITKIGSEYIIYCDISEYNIDDNTTVIEAESIKFNHKPFIGDIKREVINYYNKKISNKLTNGFVWNHMNVPLSMHDQMNYKAACDLANITESSLPVTFKFGDNYYIFNNKAELNEFWTAASKHINNCLIEGWKQKESIDWEVYK